MIDSLIKKRIFIAFSSIILIWSSVYGYRITSTRQDVLEKGKLLKAEVVRVTVGRGGKSLFVDINSKECDAGDAFGEYRKIHVGDSIGVFYLENVKYVVPDNRTSYTGYFILEKFSFFIGVILLLLSPFMREKKKTYKIEDDSLNWINDKDKSQKKLDSYFNTLLKSPNYATQIDINSIKLLYQKISELFHAHPNELLIYVHYLLYKQDFKLSYIYQSLTECSSYNNLNFEKDFEIILNSYLRKQSSFYEDILQTFLLSSYMENTEIKVKILELIKMRYQDLDKESLKKLKEIIKTCT